VEVGTVEAMAVGEETAEAMELTMVEAVASLS